jgi:hypothetical protein
MACFGNRVVKLKRPSLGSVYSWNDIDWGKKLGSTNYEITSIKMMLNIWSLSKTWLLLFGCASWTNKAISQTSECGRSFKRHGAILFHFKLSWKEEVLWSHVHSWVSKSTILYVLVCFWNFVSLFELHISSSMYKAFCWHEGG